MSITLSVSVVSRACVRLTEHCMQLEEGLAVLAELLAAVSDCNPVSRTASYRYLHHYLIIVFSIV